MNNDLKLRIVDAIMSRDNVSISQFILEYNGSTVIKSDGDEKQIMEEETRQVKDAILEYVGRLKPLVRQQLQDSYKSLWLDILEIKEVKMQVYNRGKQQDTLFNRNLVAQITHQLGNRVFITQAKPAAMAEYLEPGKGKDHPVRHKLGEMPDRIIKNAIEEALKDEF